ncbi:MAG TPA: hypothetical protein EYG92_08500 [Lutibacter sp.]|nr:hypothetical protein [Lutibacter sp.]
MRNSLKSKVLSLVALFFLGFGTLIAQDITTVEAVSNDISNNLDLEAVASIFGDAKDLEDFEKKLNDPDAHISNLDLNEDGYVDYLRIVELTEGNTHLIAIQAVLGDNQFQDVATIEVEKDRHGKTHVQVVGDVYMYGQDYIIEPYYVHRPIFFRSFWNRHYHPYHSSYYWGYYPSYFHYWSPYRTHVYVHHVHSYVNVHHTYHYVHHRRSHVAYNMHTKHRRNDYGRRNPHRSYSKRTGNVRRTNVNRRGTALRNTKSNRRDVTVNRRGTSSRVNKSNRRAEIVNKRGTSSRVNKSNRRGEVANKRGTTSRVSKSKNVRQLSKRNPRKNTQLQKDRRVSSKPQRGVSQKISHKADRKPAVRNRGNSNRKAISKRPERRSNTRSADVKRTKSVQKQSRNKSYKPSKRSADKSYKKSSKSRKSSNRTASKSSRSSSKRVAQSNRSNSSNKRSSSRGSSRRR